MSVTTRQHCVVAGEDCLAPVGWRGSSGGVFLNHETTTTLECHRCGRAVCAATTCSKIRYNHRVCIECLDEAARAKQRKDSR